MLAHSVCMSGKGSGRILDVFGEGRELTDGGRSYAGKMSVFNVERLNGVFGMR